MSKARTPKRKSDKLRLGKDTLRNLTDDQLGRVGGGIDSPTNVTCWTCDWCPVPTRYSCRAECPNW